MYGDVLERLKDISDESIDCVITSVPYYGLRDYGIKNQWGLEDTPADYLHHMWLFMIQINRVLKPTGNVFINIGDTYAGSGKGAWKEKHKSKETPETIPDKKFKLMEDVRRKSRLMIPERFSLMSVFQLDYILRNDIIWYKTNAMPSSIKDRLTTHFEHIYHFVKEPKYYYNLDTIRVEPKSGCGPSFNRDVRDQKKGKFRAGELMRERSKEEMDKYDSKGFKKQDNFIDPKTGKPDPTKKGFNERWKNLHYKGQTIHTMHIKRTLGEEVISHPLGKNPGDVWVIPTRPYRGAHYATFPLSIPLRCIGAGCPPGGIVLDPFMGSGTSAVAAELLGRDWIGIDLDKRNEELIIKRLGEKK